MKLLLALMLLFSLTAAQPLPPPLPRADDGSTIDVLVAFTQTARAIAGGQDQQAVAMIDAAIDGVNQAFATAGVTTQLEVVLYQQVFYLEQVNIDFHADLNNLTGTSDGWLDDLHALRDAYAADIVLLLTGTWFYIYTGDSALSTTPDAAEGFAVWEAKGLDDNGGVFPAHWIARLLGADATPPFDPPDAATMNANLSAVANYRDSATRLVPPVGLIQNGGFEIDMDEDAVPDFWKASGWAAGDTRKCGTSHTHGGDCSVKLKLAGGGNRLTQKADGAAVHIGDTLRLSGYAKASKSGACIELTIKVSYVTQPNVKATGDGCLPSIGDWHAFILDEPAAGEVASVKVKIAASGTGKLWLDDVELAAVPAAARGGAR